MPVMDWLFSENAHYVWSFSDLQTL